MAWRHFWRPTFQRLSKNEDIGIQRSLSSRSFCWKLTPCCLPRYFSCRQRNAEENTCGHFDLCAPYLGALHLNGFSRAAIWETQQPPVWLPSSGLTPQRGHAACLCNHLMCRRQTRSKRAQRFQRTRFLTGTRTIKRRFGMPVNFAKCHRTEFIPHPAPMLPLARKILAHSACTSTAVVEFCSRCPCEQALSP